MGYTPEQGWHRCLLDWSSNLLRFVGTLDDCSWFNLEQQPSWIPGSCLHTVRMAGWDWIDRQLVAVSVIVSNFCGSSHSTLEKSLLIGNGGLARGECETNCLEKIYRGVMPAGGHNTPVHVMVAVVFQSRAHHPHWWRSHTPH